MNYAKIAKAFVACLLSLILIAILMAMILKLISYCYDLERSNARSKIIMCHEQGMQAVENIANVTCVER